MKFLLKILFSVIFLTYLQIQINAQDNNADYPQAIQSADKYFTQGDFLNAKAYYQIALNIKPDDLYAKKQLDESIRLLKEKLNVVAQYSSLIQQADKLFGAGQYADARSKYLEASRLKPEDSYPGEKIKQIAEHQAESVRQDEEFNSLLKDGDSKYQAGKYDEASDSFQKALGIKPDNANAQQKLEQTEAKIKEGLQSTQNFSKHIEAGDQYFKIKNYSKAIEEYKLAEAIKPGDQLVNKKISEAREAETLRENYEKLVNEADELYISKNQVSAREKYLQASALLPKEKYPLDMIAKIDEDKQTTNIPAPPAQSVDVQKEKPQQSYEQIIASADDFFNQGLFSDARTTYMNASQVKPGESYPKQKISEIDKLLNEEKNNVNRYNLLISDADRFFSNKEFSKAKDYYTQALTLKPGETYPKQRLEDIEKKVNEEKQRISTLYNKVVQTADSCFITGGYEMALQHYEQARTLKPAEQHPIDRIAQIKVFVSDNTQKKENWQKIVSQADGYFKVKDFENARSKYEEALLIIPGNNYPSQKIEEITILIEKEKNDEIVNQYTKAIGQADQFLKAREYEKAKNVYSDALKIKPDEQYPRDKIDEINRLALENQQQKSGSYNKIIADADKYFLARAYDQAVDLYRQALQQLPEEQYPQDMLSKISAILEEYSQITVMSSPITIEKNQIANFTFNPVPVADREKSYIILRIKNSVDTQAKVLMSFGKDKSKSGGIIIKLLPGTVENEYIFRVGTMYNWFSIDNNYISLYPEGGNIELMSVKISRSN